MLGWILLLFVALPFIELWLLIELWQRIGPWTTLGIVFGTGIVGALLARWQGMAALRSLTTSWRTGRSVTVELVAGAAFLVGAAFLLTPGVITDVVGFLLMVPPVRRFVARRFIKRFKDNITVVSYGPGGARVGPTGSRMQRDGPETKGEEPYDTTGYTRGDAADELEEG